MSKWIIRNFPDGTRKLEKVLPTPEEIEQRNKLNNEHRKKRKEYIKSRNEELAKNRGFESFSDYVKVRNEKWLRSKGFESDYERQNEWAKRNGFESRAEQVKLKRYERGKASPHWSNTDCSLWLGVHVAEKLLPEIFDNVEMMPFSNEGFDAICIKGYRIDVKSTCISMKNQFGFHIRKNKNVDWFIMFAFDNRRDLNLLYGWLMKSNEVIVGRNGLERKLNEISMLTITNKKQYMIKFKKYELSDVLLKKARELCKKLKEEMNNDYKP